MHLLRLLPADQARRLAPDHHKREDLRSGESDVDLSPVVLSRPDVLPVLHALVDAVAIEKWGPLEPSRRGQRRLASSPPASQFRADRNRLGQRVALLAERFLAGVEAHLQGAAWQDDSEIISAHVRVTRDLRRSSRAANPLVRAGAGDGNRTRVASLEDWGSTIELRPRDAHASGPA